MYNAVVYTDANITLTRTQGEQQKSMILCEWHTDTYLLCNIAIHEFCCFHHHVTFSKSLLTCVYKLQ